MSAPPTLVKSLAANWIGHLIAVVVGLFVPSYTLRSLGGEQYGLWALLVSITAQLCLLDFGVRQAVTRYAASNHSTHEDAKTKALLSAALQILRIASIAGFLIILFVAAFLTDLFSIPESQVMIARVLLVALAIDGVLDLLTGPHSAVLSGLERNDLIQVGNSLRLILNGAFVVGATSLGWGIGGVAAALILARFISRSYLVLAVSRTVRQQGVDRGNIRGTDGVGEAIEDCSPASLRSSLLRFGMFAFLIIVGTRICTQVDLLIIGASLSTLAVTAYAVPLILIDQIRMIVDAAQTLLFSRLSKLCNDNAPLPDNRETTFVLMDRWARYSPLLMLSVGIHLIFFGRDFIRLWMGQELEGAAQVLTLLVVALFVSIPLLGYQAALFAKGSPGIVARVVLIEAGLKVLVSFVLVAEFGIVGVAAGSLAATLLVSLPCSYLYYAPVTGYSMKRYTRVGVLPTYTISALYCMVVVFAKYLVPISSPVSFLVANALPLPFMFVLVARYVILKDDYGYMKRSSPLFRAISR